MAGRAPESLMTVRSPAASSQGGAPAISPVPVTTVTVAAAAKPSVEAGRTTLKQAGWVGLILPAVLLVAWQLVAQLGWVKPHFLPSPTTVVQTAYEMIFETGLLKDMWYSLRIIFQGAVIGGVIGLLSGFATGSSRTVEKLVAPLLDAIRQIPPLAWVPLLVLWLGVGNTGKVALIAKAVFFPIFLNTLQGIRGVSLDQIEVGRIFGYSRVLLLRRIIVPSALPSIFIGLRYAVGLSWSVMIAAELLGSRFGLGFRLHMAQEHLMTDQLFVIVILIGLVGYALDLVIRILQGRVLHWRRTFAG
jgi:sulfonate transport system permease protein